MEAEGRPVLHPEPAPVREVRRQYAEQVLAAAGNDAARAAEILGKVSGKFQTTKLFASYTSRRALGRGFWGVVGGQ
jgi:hypothetical protein